MITQKQTLPKSTLAEVYYCTIDAPLPATAAVRFRAARRRARAEVIVNGEHTAEIAHVIIHPHATQVSVLADVQRLRNDLGQLPDAPLPSCFLQIENTGFVSMGGRLEIDEDWPTYFIKSAGFEIDTRRFQTQSVLLAISAPIKREHLLDQLDGLIENLIEDGLSRGVRITSRGVHQAYEKDGVLHERSGIALV